MCIPKIFHVILYFTWKRCYGIGVVSENSHRPLEETCVCCDHSWVITNAVWCIFSSILLAKFFYPVSALYCQINQSKTIIYVDLNHLSYMLSLTGEHLECKSDQWLFISWVESFVRLMDQIYDGLRLLSLLLYQTCLEFLIDWSVFPVDYLASVLLVLDSPQD